MVVWVEISDGNGVVMLFEEGYRSAVLRDTPWAWYRMDDVAGDLTDSSGNERHATGGSGTAPRVSGKFGTALNCASQPNYRERPSGTSLSVYWSLELWVKPVGTISLHANTQYAITNGGNRWAFPPHGGISYTTGLSIGTNGLVYGEHAANHAYAPLNWAGTLPTNSFTHVVVTCDNSVPRFYVNGALVASNTGWVGGVRYAPYFIGSYAIWSDNPVGQMDEVAYYSYVLNPNQIMDHYEASVVGLYYGSKSPMVMG